MKKYKINTFEDRCGYCSVERRGAANDDSSDESRVW